jgi:hypothetical protein
MNSRSPVPVPPLVLALFLGLVLSMCNRRAELPQLWAADSINIVRENMAHRLEAERFFRDDPSSPFNADTLIEFHGIRWFPVNPRYLVRSVLHLYEHPETVTVFGTKGEERKQLKYGYFEFTLPDEHGMPSSVRLNVYKFTPYDSKRYAKYRDVLSVWFTDKTTGRETYEVGRYVDAGAEHPDKSHVYTIDLNKAYNPYCAYNDRYSCAIPRKEDHIEIALRAGEMKYHD